MRAQLSDAAVLCTGILQASGSRSELTVRFLSAQRADQFAVTAPAGFDFQGARTEFGLASVRDAAEPHVATVRAARNPLQGDSLCRLGAAVNQTCPAPRTCDGHVLHTSTVSGGPW